MTGESLVKFDAPGGRVDLYRYPRRPRESLRAWDAADEYLLQALVEREYLSENARLLLVNDNFGALAVTLHQYSPTSWTDSHLAKLAMEANCEANGLSIDGVDFVESTGTIDQGKTFDIVLIKIPKTLALLESQLSILSGLCSSSVVIVAAGMVKGIHKSTLNLFEKHLGPCITSLAKKKARLIFCERNTALSPEHLTGSVSYVLENTDLVLGNLANVFSRESLDIGTRFFLDYLPASEAPRRIVDLGCGNGVIGLVAAQKNPNASLVFRDESYMAVASAETNFKTAFGDSREAEFEATDCLGEIAPGSVDLILNNPPFHQHNAVGEFVAWQMFQESLSALGKGGELWVIANRHLDYQAKLKRLFGACERVAGNNKFVVLRAIKRR